MPDQTPKRETLEMIDPELAPLVLAKSVALEVAARRSRAHPIYGELKDSADLAVFMQHHAFAVWDFMNLVKALQRSLTCVSVPWMPVGDPAIRTFVNEIVCGEESDSFAGLPDCGIAYSSHFELYLEAMRRAGVATEAIDRFLSSLRLGAGVETSLKLGCVPDAVRNFVGTTWKFVQSGKSHVIASAFTFGREDPIPSMFRRILRSTTLDDGFDLFRIYMQRHISTDEDHHSVLAHNMLRRLCVTGEQILEAETAAVEAIDARIRLWDGILEAINDSRVNGSR